VPQAAWETLLSPDLINVVVVDPRKLSAIGLYRYIHYLRANHQDPSRYQLALWIRIMAPFSTGVMVFLAVPFVFGSLRAMGVGQRIVIGTMVGLVFYLLNQTLNHLGVAYDLNPFFSAAFPTLLFLGVALWLMRRAY
jgi:lipopolysaccharide export system permease protein